MARKRQIDPGFWTSEQVASVKVPERLMFLGCISNADDEGRLKGSPAYLKMAIFPADRMTLTRVQAMRDAIVTAGLAKLYADADGEPLLWMPNWHKHQYMNRSYPSKLPPHPDDPGRPSQERRRRADPL